MSYGKMNGFAFIKETKHEQDSEGFSVEIAETLASVHCYREGRHGSKRWANLAAFSDCTDLFRFRKLPNLKVTTEQFIEYDGERFDIISVEDVKGRGMYIEVLARKVVASIGKGGHKTS